MRPAYSPGPAVTRRPPRPKGLSMPHDHQDCALEAGPCRRTVLATGALGAVGAVGAVALAGCGAGDAATQAGGGTSGGAR